MLGLMPAADSLFAWLQKKSGWLTKTRLFYLVLAIFLVGTIVAFWGQAGQTQAKFEVSKTIYSSTHEGAVLLDLQGGFTCSFLLEAFGDRKLDRTFTTANFREKILDTCWVRDNGGINNIFVSAVTFYPRTGYSIQDYLKTSRISVTVKPLPEFLKEKGFSTSDIQCR
jgi:hypothetical protein